MARGVTPAAEPSLAEVGEGPRTEEAEVVAIGGTGQGAELARRSGRFFLVAVSERTDARKATLLLYH